MGTVKEIADYWREKFVHAPDWTEEQFAIDYFSQVAANSGCSFGTWLVDHELASELIDVAEKGFSQFNGGMIGVSLV